MEKLPLDDPRWLQLKARGAMPYVMKKLRELVEKNPSNYFDFEDLWPYFCSESTTWDSSFAAAPYIIECSKLAPKEHIWEYGYVIGLMQAYMYDDSDVPEYLLEGWERSKIDAFEILMKSIVLDCDDVQTRYLMAAISALKGHRKLAEVLNDLDCCEECSARLVG